MRKYIALILVAILFYHASVFYRNRSAVNFAATIAISEQSRQGSSGPRGRDRRAIAEIYKAAKAMDCSTKIDQVLVTLGSPDIKDHHQSGWVIPENLLVFKYVLVKAVKSDADRNIIVVYQLNRRKLLSITYPKCDFAGCESREQLWCD